MSEDNKVKVAIVGSGNIGGTLARHLTALAVTAGSFVPTIAAFS